MGGHILVHAVATGVTHCKIGLRFYQIIGIVVSIVKWFEKVFHEEESDYMFPVTPAVFWRVVISGMVGGVVTWLIALALDRFILKQIICGPTADPSMCTNSAQIGAYVALVLVSVMLVPIIALNRVRRPLLVVLAAVGALWGVGVSTAEVWWLSLIVTTMAFGFVYATAMWLNRIRGNVAAIIFLAIFVLLARVVLSL